MSPADHRDHHLVRAFGRIGGVAHEFTLCVTCDAIVSQRAQPWVPPEPGRYATKPLRPAGAAVEGGAR